MKKCFLLLVFWGCLWGAAAQKKALQMEDYRLWRRVDNPVMSDDGQWVAYRYTPVHSGQEDDIPMTYLRNMKTGKVDSLRNVRYVTFFNNNRWIKYTLPAKPESSSGDTTVLHALQTGQKIYWNRDYDFRESGDSPLLVYSYPIGEKGKWECLVVRNIETGDSTVIEPVFRYRLSGRKNILFVTEGPSGKVLKGGPLTGRHRSIYHGEEGEIRDFYLEANGVTGTFTVQQEDGSGSSGKVYAFDLRNTSWQLLFDPAEIGVLQGKYRAKANANALFNGGNSMFIDIEPLYPEEPAPQPEKISGFEPQIWRWNDEEVPLRNGGKKRPARPVRPRYVYHIDRQECVLVSPDDTYTLSTPYTDRYDYALLLNSKPYTITTDWREGEHADIFLVDLRTGERKLLFKDFRGRPVWSPGGEYVLFYCGPEKCWKALHPATGKIRDISSEIGYPVFDEDFDRPAPPPAYDIAGWSSDDRKVYLYDRYDIWEVDLEGGKPPHSVTKGYGRQHGIALRIVKANQEYKVLEPHKEYILQGVNQETRDQSFFRFTAMKHLKKLTEGPYSYYVYALSPNGKYMMFSRQNYQEFRDIWWSKTDFSSPVRLTDANPQQKEYRWGSVRMVAWTNYAGMPNRGLLYLPEDYDPSRKYPVIVNFYETHTEGLHTYLLPDFSSAMIDPVTYVSNDYIVFMPDVHFVVGSPGESSYNAVVSGTQMLIDRGIADPDRIGIQGHSWSGYQTAYILTRTDLFRCANAGAVVSNMVSAYTGIRKQVGMPRMFMYEETQCRIGKPMWGEGNTELYIRNSPIYYADKIETPLLLFHNDEDEAVPYSEGLNLFLALRRLQRPVWLLNYKGESHFVFDPEAQKDWTIRLRQFFDHYLKDQPFPEWMK